MNKIYVNLILKFAIKSGHLFFVSNFENCLNTIANMELFARLHTCLLLVHTTIFLSIQLLHWCWYLDVCLPQSDWCFIYPFVILRSSTLFICVYVFYSYFYCYCNILFTHANEKSIYIFFARLKLPKLNTLSYKPLEKPSIP